MNVLVDTSIWSLALRRKTSQLSAEQLVLRDALVELIEQGQARLIGAIRQEILSGIRAEAMFQKVRGYLNYFLDEPLAVEDYEKAAEIFNACMAAGLAASSVDMLISAVAIRRGWQVYSSDRDFERYSQVAHIELYVS